MTEGIVPIHGKQYKTVAYRVNEFRSQYPEYTVSTELVEANETLVVMKAGISNEQGRLLATGFAEEVRAASKINRTSALENAETSAIGRALAALGLAGTEYASADEVANAITQQNAGMSDKEVNELLIENTTTMLAYSDSILAIKAGISLDDLSTASEEWFSLDDEVKRRLWKAPSKGGPFTTKEREVIKSTEFRTANGGGDESEAQTG